MTTMLKIPTKVRKRSKDRPKSLILLIPAKARDMLELKAEDDIYLEVCMENEERFIKISKID